MAYAREQQCTSLDSNGIQLSKTGLKFSEALTVSMLKVNICLGQSGILAVLRLFSSTCKCTMDTEIMNFGACQLSEY